MREVVAELSNPVMLYSIGKDMLLHLARKLLSSALPFHYFMLILLGSSKKDRETKLLKQ